MNKILYDEVPFSRDYNYDKLTNSEASQVLNIINGDRRHNYKYIVGTVVKYTLLLLVSFIGIYITIFVIDWKEIFSSSVSLKVILEKIFTMFIHILIVSFCVKELIFGVKFRKVYNKFLIAKGNVADVQKINVKPDDFHPNGIKVLLTVAVSDSEALPPFDISLRPYDDVIIGDSIIIISFPGAPARTPFYSYLYQPWEQRYK